MAAAAGVLFKSQNVHISPARSTPGNIQECIRDSVGSASDGLLAGPTLPDANRVSLHRRLAAEGAVFVPLLILWSS